MLLGLFTNKLYDASQDFEFLMSISFTLLSQYVLNPFLNSKQIIFSISLSWLMDGLFGPINVGI